MKKKLEYIRYLILDVDGTMTDGGIYYDSLGNEFKKFNVKDAAGIFAVHAAGIQTVVLTGRKSVAVQKRMEELQITMVYDGIKNKEAFLKKFMLDKNINSREIGYIGDDLNDLLAMKLVGFVACPFDAADEVKKIADYICVSRGGDGAVRESIYYMLNQINKWTDCIKMIYDKEEEKYEMV